MCKIFINESNHLFPQRKSQLDQIQENRFKKVKSESLGQIFGNQPFDDRTFFYLSIYDTTRDESSIMISKSQLFLLDTFV
ncbi:hypothetical protein BpHYR1_053376 [Brachionus plicatilis]|uniref:Uncharacterized protein n=1 Tax=Brachionus plicatilis TaxID=10195 RepID=A0A3M7P348_BRAPC|nr:hypothetical protein BpHYR1_053376 [Brachionus plicatilis]